MGVTDTGKVFEQWAEVEKEDGKKGKWRFITIKLNTETRDGESEITVLTNLPKNSVDAIGVAELYRKRWSIETMFQELEAHLHSEINTLGYPKAALFGFCVALISYNILAVVKAAMRSVHGEEKIANEVSGYYLSGEIARTQEGMEIAIEPDEWAIFQTMKERVFIDVLLKMSRNIILEKYKKHRRGPKKKPPKRTSSKNQPHVSTARLLKQVKKSP